MPAAGGKATSALVMGRDAEPTIFELSSPGRRSASFRTTGVPEWRADELVPRDHLRDEPASYVELSERELVAHFSRTSNRQYSVDLGGYETVTDPSNGRGLEDVAALPERLDDEVVGIMLTNPNTLGLFEEDIAEIAAAVHEVGGLLYYDGANLNAILGVTRPGDMGFDIVHMNLHKPFAVPHGGGGPGAGPVAVSERLAPYLPGPRPVLGDDGAYRWQEPAKSIGRVHSWHGNALALARAYSYILANGGDGLRRVAEAAVLNANWLRTRLRGIYDLPHDRPAMHEFVAPTSTLKKSTGLRALDVAKRLLEEGFHSPTVYFPLIVDEALMIEPTETESPQTLEALGDALERIAAGDAEEARQAPRTTPVRRVDEARAARHLVPTWDAREYSQVQNAPMLMDADVAAGVPGDH